MGINGFHLGDEFSGFLFCDWRLCIVFVILEDGGEHVGDSLAFTASKGVGAGIDVLSEQLHEYLATLAVASDDATGFPEVDVIEKLAAGQSYFANEQLVKVVGG